MQIVDLILSICLVSDPGSCRNEHLYFESHGSLRACLMEALPAMADWAGDHPQWRINGFHCEWAGVEEDI